MKPTSFLADCEKKRDEGIPTRSVSDRSRSTILKKFNNEFRAGNGGAAIRGVLELPRPIPFCAAGSISFRASWRCC